MLGGESGLVPTCGGMMEEKEENQARTPENTNMWYVLMTLYGEQTGQRVDEALHDSNRAAWNAWACQAMSDEERAKAAKSSGVTVAELAAWPVVMAEVARLHEAEMLRRNGDGFAYAGLPDAARTVDFRRIRFAHRLVMKGSVFGSNVQFNHASLQKSAYFENATFMKMAVFGNAQFDGSAVFETATFNGEANFNNVKFRSWMTFKEATFRSYVRFHSAAIANDAYFRSARFESDAVLGGAVFNGDASFESAIFSEHTSFASAAFGGFARFSKAQFGVSGEVQAVSFADCQFEKPISFRDSAFHSRYPDFSGAILHNKTDFTDKPDHWPKQGNRVWYLT